MRFYADGTPDELRAFFDYLFANRDVLQKIQATEEAILSFGKDTLDLLKAIDTETTRIADKFAVIVAQLTNAPTAEEEAQITAAANAEIEKLRGIGADPANPIPTPAPVPAPTSAP